MKRSIFRAAKAFLGSYRHLACGATVILGGVVALGASPVLAAPTMYVTLQGANKIQSVAPDGTVTNLPVTGVSLSNPTGLAFDGAGNLYTSNRYSPNIGKVNIATGVQTKFNTSGPGLNYAMDLAFDGAGNLYVANTNAGTILKYDSAGAGVQFNVSSLTYPRALAFDAGGNLFVLDAGTSVIKFDSAGNGTSFSTGLSGAYGLAFDSIGRLYTLNTNQVTIVRFDSVGNKTAVPYTGTYSYPKDLAFDADDNLYITNTNGNDLVTKFVYNPSSLKFEGTTYASFTNPPEALVFVPEPSSAALLGLGALLVMRRRRA